MFYEINNVAVFTGTLAAFFVGWLWYGPLFGKQWMAMMGYTKANMKSMKMKPGITMVLGFLSLLLIDLSLNKLCSENTGFQSGKCVRILRFSFS